jgi:hypothetical protein
MHGLRERASAADASVADVPVNSTLGISYSRMGWLRKVDGDFATPNYFVALRPDIAEEKVSLLETHFPSQAAKRWFDRDLFMSLMRLRGMEAVAPERLAEAFTCRKVVFSP